MKALVVVAAIFTVAVANLASFDCKMKQLGQDFAQQLQPFRSRTSFQQLADALNGAPGQGEPCAVAPSDVIEDGAVWPPAIDSVGANTVYYVDPNDGSDSNPGTLEKPFLTVDKVSVGRFCVCPNTKVLVAGASHWVCSRPDICATIPL